MKKIIGLIIGCFVFSLVSGCALPGYDYEQNKTMTKAGTAGVGAVVGQAIGRNTGGTLLGTGIGYIVGDLIAPFTVPRDRGGYQQAPPPSGNCHWRQETEWGPDGRSRQIQYRVCEGDTEWQPGQ